MVTGLHNLYGEYYGSDSRCIEQAGPWNATVDLRVTYSDTFGGGCYKVQTTPSAPLIHCVMAPPTYCVTGEVF